MWLSLAWLLFFPMHYLDIAIDLKTLRPSCYGMPFLFFGIELAERRRTVPAGFCLLTALLTQEDFALITGSIGLIFFLREFRFAAADRLVVPLQCEYYALEGIAMLTRVINQVRENGINPGLDILGVVMTMFDSRTRLGQSVVAEVRQHFGEKVFETVIPRTTRLAEAPSHGKPIMAYDPYSAGAAAYEVLSGEVAQRLGLPGVV
jgi:cellulose biosynthesis protein BcsQ